MNNTIKLFLILSAALYLFTGCNNLDSKINYDIENYQMSKFNPGIFNNSKLSFSNYASISNKFDNSARLYTGDVSGTAEEEIIIITDNEIRIFNLNGDLIVNRIIDDNKLGSGLLADIDGDNKQDIIIGGKLEKSARLIGFSGSLQPLFDFTYGDLYDCITIPHFVHEGKIFFSSTSRLNINPKISGLCDPFQDSIEWEFYSGPIPTNIAANKDCTMYSISNYPENSASLKIEEDYYIDHDQYKSSLLILEDNGNLLLQKSLGNQFSTTKAADDVISKAEQRFIDINNDGQSEIICGISHLSEFYPGKSAIEIYNLSGDLLNSQKFEENTEIDFSFHESANGIEIAVLLNQSCKFYILDEDLSIKKTWQPPFSSGEGILHEFGDYTGDGNLEYVISIDNILYILNSKLETIFSTARYQKIYKAGIISADKSPVLYIGADSIQLFKPGADKTGSLAVFTNPPGADILIDGKLLTELPISGIIPPLEGENTYTIQAILGNSKSEIEKIRIESYHHHSIVLDIEGYQNNDLTAIDNPYNLPSPATPKIPIKHWSDYKKVKYNKKSPDLYPISKNPVDYAGNSDHDLLFKDLSTGILSVRSSDMQTLTIFIPSYEQIDNVYNSPLDIDNNKKHDLLAVGILEQGYEVYSADGRLQSKKTFLKFNDSRLSLSPIYENDVLILPIISGFSLQPRGILATNPEKETITFFNPTAGWPMNILYSENNHLIPNYSTPDNGCTLTALNGDAANDSHYYIYLYDKFGELLPQSFNPNLDSNNGQIFFYSNDLNHDGTNEIYAVTQKDRYYTGKTEIYELDVHNGTLTGPIYSSGKNFRLLISQTIFNGHPAIAAIANTLDDNNFKIEILDKNFTKIHEINLPEYFLLTFNTLSPTDIDNDGNTEIFLVNENDIFVYDQNGNLLHKFINQKNDGKFQKLLIDDTNLDGKEDIIIVTENSVSVYSY